MIVCIRLPYFVAAVEQRADRRLQRRPLVIGGMPWQLTPVQGLSHESARWGVRLGLPLRQAHTLCPPAQFLPPAWRRYEQASQDVAALLLSFTPLIEPRWAQPALVFYAGWEETAPDARLPQTIGRILRDETALVPAIGLGMTKFAAYLAAKSAPAGVLRHGNDALLARFPLAWLSLPDELQRRLRLLGVRTLGELARLPADAIRQQFGAAGWTVYRLARGDDPRPVLPLATEERLTWSHSVDDPIVDSRHLEYLVRQGATVLAGQMGQQALAAHALTLRVTLENGDCRDESSTLSQPVSQAHFIARHALHLLARLTWPCGVTGVALRVATLKPVVAGQLSLFDRTATQARALGETVIDLQARYGAERFGRIAPDQPAARLIERRYQWQDARP